jgi:hypothetical protein
MRAKESCEQENRMLDDIIASQSPRTFLLSFPRSGNTWLRYCLEFLTERPSLAYYALNYPTQRPLGWSAGFPIDHRRAPIIKVHRAQEMMLCCNNEIICNPNPETDTLILLLRNPKECFGSRKHQNWQSFLSNPGIGCGYEPRSYFANIDLFETWPNHLRLLVYYEDLITDPRATLARILTFLKEPLTRLDHFMDHHEEHKKISLTLYRRSISEGKDILFHSHKASHTYLLQMDNLIAATYPHIWNTYLCKRYTTTS